MSRSKYLVAFTGAVALFGCGQHEAVPQETLRGALLSGMPDTIHSFVVGIYTLEAWEPALCTGTLVGPNLVLTSRHCVAPRADADSAVDCTSSRFGKTYDAALVQVTTAEHMYPELLARPQPVAKIWVRDTDDEVCGNDLALLAVAGYDEADGAGGSAGGGPASAGAGGASAGDRDAAGGGAAATAGARNGAGATPVAHEIEAAVPRLDEPAEEGEVFAAVGYGSNGETFGERLGLEGLEVGCVGRTCSKRIVDGEFFGAGALCHGDSGGPALDDKKRVFGVASRGDARCTESVYSEVATHREWLLATAREASAFLGQKPPRWADDGASGAGGAEGQGAAGSLQTAAGATSEPAQQSPAQAEAPPERRPARVRLGGGCSVLGARAEATGRGVVAWMGLLVLGIRGRRGRRQRQRV